MVKFIAPPGVTKVRLTSWGPHGESEMVADVQPGQVILPPEIDTGDKPKLTPSPPTRNSSDLG